MESKPANQDKSETFEKGSKRARLESLVSESVIKKWTDAQNELKA